jgi:hypothetical protein
VNATQRYVANELTHFIGRALSDPERQYDLLKRILSDGVLGEASMGSLPISLTVNWAASTCDNRVFSPQVVCFCDIPVADLHIHMRKYSSFGIAFRKAFLVAQGATPVFYLTKNVARTPMRCEYFDDMLKAYKKLFDRAEESRDISLDQQHELWDLRRFFEFQVFSFAKFFDETLPEDHPENFYMEREWRVVGRVRFDATHVERIIVPRSFGTRFRADMPSYNGQLQFVD